MIPDFCNEFIGIPFQDKGRSMAGFDCWGLVRAVYERGFGIYDLPDYVEEYQSCQHGKSVAAAVRAGLADGWVQTDTAAPGVLVILRLAGMPFHCGICVGDGYMLHANPKMGVILERLNSLMWKNRIEGFYEHAKSD